MKLFIEEVGSPETRALARSASQVHTSLVAFAECRSGLARARRGGRLDDEEYAEARALFLVAWESYLAIEPAEALIRLAGDLAERYALTGFDAVHLASAVTLQRELGEPVTFSAADERLMAAAAGEGLIAA